MKKIYANENLQRKWEQAVKYLRNGRGWVADGKVGYRLPIAPDPSQAPLRDKVTPIAGFRAFVPTEQEIEKEIMLRQKYGISRPSFDRFIDAKTSKS